MTSIFLCCLAFAICYKLGRRSLVAGLIAVLAIGYLYGILRANFVETFSHFIFDAGAVGLYGAQLFRVLRPEQRAQIQPLKNWLILLIGWPLLMFLVPLQDPLVQLVGLRGNIFLLPFLIFGARLEGEDLYKLTLGVAVLNLIAFAFAIAEFFLGVEKFYPYSAVTELIYRSKDVANFTAYRIPSIFTSAHAYSGTMVMTLPLLVGAWVQRRATKWQGYLIAAALMAALLGVFMAAARVHMLILALLLVITTLSGQLKPVARFGWIIMLIGVGWVVSSEERLQRFLTLQDTGYVAERVAGSVNMDFFTLAANYPMGNGLGGGGTSIPYFLQDLIRDPVGMENEFARIMLEQGIPGLFLWIVFIVWIFTRRTISRRETWYLSRRLAWFASAIYFCGAWLGVGLLTSVPQTCFILLCAGWITVRQTTVTDNRTAPRLVREPVLARQYGRST
ncbi:MAG: hypothetical protein AB1489_22070 [Acidobacteriota bacterium]